LKPPGRVSRPSFEEILGLLRCPACGSDLEIDAGALRCNKCGGRYSIIGGRIADMVGSSRGWVGFFERFPKLYDPWSRVGWRVAGRGSLKGYYRELVEGLEGGVLLDVGCGTGTLIAMLEEKGYRGPIIGVDISMAMLNTAVRKTSSALFLRASMESIPLRDLSVDHYISSLAIHIAEDKRRVLGEMVRILRRGGSYRIVVATANSIRGMLFSRLLRVGALDEEIYTEMLRSLGLEVLRSVRYGAFTAIYGAKPMHNS